MSTIQPGQIDYTSRDYASLRTDLVKLIRNRTGLNWSADDPSDIGVALLEAFAYVGDTLNYYIDRAANESFIDTATQKKTLFNLASLFGYRPSGPTPASVDITFTNISDYAIDLPVGTQVLAPLQYGNFTEAYFETTSAVTQLAPGASVTIPALEGKTANTDRPGLIDPATNTPLPISLGVSNGAPNQEVVLFDTNIVDGTIKAYVGQGEAFTEWKWVDSLIEYGPQDNVFTTKINVDGTTSLVFGDGVNGAIPGNQQLLSTTYRVSVGAAGNISVGQLVEVSFIPGNVNPSAPSQLIVNNQLAAVDGADADDVAQIRAKLKAAISARRRAVTLSDYERLALQVPRIGRAHAVASVYSSVILYLQPQYDGTTSPGIDPDDGTSTPAMVQLESDVQTFMADKMPANTTLTVIPPTYADIDVSLIIGVGAAYKQDEVVRAVTAKLLDVNTGLYTYNSYGFGELVAFSDLVVAAAQVDGVVSVTVSTLARHGHAGAGDIQMEEYEIPRLKNSNLQIQPVGGLL